MTKQMEFLTAPSFSEMSTNLKNAVSALREGKIILLLDAHERENEGDLIVAAEKITAESMNFLIKQGSGVVCVALPKERLDYLGLPLMIPDNTNFFRTAFTVSIEARSGVTTGVSAKDRAHTIQVVMADDAESSHLARPGHVFPLAAQKNGVFERMGHTEGSVDLMRIAGLKPGAVLCELMNDDGSMTIGDERVRFAKNFDIPLVSIEEIFFHRMRTEPTFVRSQKNVSSLFGELIWHTFLFLDEITVDVFHRKNSKNERAKLTVLSGDNLAHRYFLQVLCQTDDDPLCSSLSLLKEEKTDFVIMTTLNDQSLMKNTEARLKLHGVICRTLRELLVNDISSQSLSEDLTRIASEFFAINVK
jgi:3,4-dihydroxy-2-butanone 4-phosphate synthase